MEQVAQEKELGNAAFIAGDWTAALRHYSAALRHCDGLQRPVGLHFLHGNRAATHLKLGDAAAALQDAEAALAVEPRWVKALFRKAAALQLLGRPGAAAVAAQQAAALDPGNTQVQTLLQQLGPQAAAAAAAESTAAAAAAVSGQDGGRRRKPLPTAALLPGLLAKAPWEYVPSPDRVDENLLLLLHGLGDRPSAFARLARSMALPQTAALALGGPQEVPFSEGGRSWYTVFTDSFDLIEGRPGEQRRVRSLDATVSALQQLLGQLRQRCGWQAHRVHVIGFSQGGTVALELARQQHSLGQPLGSCVAVSAALLPEQLAAGLSGSKEVAAGQGSSTPVLITHGDADKALSRQAVEATAAALRSTHSMEVVVHRVAGKGHAMPQGAAEMRRLMEFWAAHLSRRPTAADLPPEVAAGGGELLEVKPGEVSVQLLEEHAL
ncbi:hypothetical protein D9Q98_005398 [Chlorella vulgaris]|uniref:Phospholipase/carboxylesterase/thioesterase domain-containing protein n=1 Tax=Chlorella vulgaris TaxID=3077 RepID=A0A9D4TLU5_CHLVU|nr:hypothetical protein D9Q98_005398 [Chlorella vulgaris]